MRKFVPVLTAIAVVLASGATALAGEKKTVTISCLEAPQLCKCKFLECLWSTARVQPIPGNRVLYGATIWDTQPIKTIRCEDLSPSACRAAGCAACE